MLSDLVELVVSFIQYFASLVSNPSTKVPDEWRDPAYYMSVLTIKMSFVGDLAPLLGDLRVYFTLVAVCAPLGFTLLGLMFLLEKYVVVWYLMGITGLMLTLAGVSGSIVSATTHLPIKGMTTYIMIGIGGVLLAVTFVLYQIRSCLTRKGSEKLLKQAKVIKKETSTVNCYNQLETFVYFGVLLMFGVTFSGLVPALSPLAAMFDTNTLGPRLVQGLAFVAIGLSIPFFVWLMMGFIVKGRILQWKIRNKIERGFLRVLLLSMSMAYIPIVDSIYVMLNCNVFSCGAGTRLFESGTVIALNATKQTCASCVVASSQRCPARFSASLCRGGSESRLEYQTNLACSAVQAFFWPAAGLIVVQFMLGLPILFWYLVRKTSVVMLKDFPVTIPSVSVEGMTDVEKREFTWQKKVRTSKNVAQFLFQPFSFRWRYTRLLLLLQKLLIVGFTTYVIRNQGFSPELYSLVSTLVLYVVGTLFLGVSRPFIARLETGVSTVMQALLSICSGLTLASLLGYAAPSWAGYFSMVLVAVVPIGTLIAGVWLEWRNGRDEEEASEKELATRIDREVNKKLSEEEREMEEKARIEEEKCRAAREELRQKQEAEDEEAKAAVLSPAIEVELVDVTDGNALCSPSTTPAEIPRTQPQQQLTTGDDAKMIFSFNLLEASGHAVPAGKIEGGLGATTAFAPGSLRNGPGSPNVCASPGSPPQVCGSPRSPDFNQMSSVLQPLALPNPFLGPFVAPRQERKDVDSTTYQAASVRPSSKFGLNTPTLVSPSNEPLLRASPTATPNVAAISLGSPTKAPKVGGWTNESTSLEPVRGPLSPKERRMRKDELTVLTRIDVRHQLGKEEEAIQERQADVDLFIDRSVKKGLQCFLMVTGAIGAVAFACALLGLMAIRNDSVFSVYDDPTVANAFAGYRTWENFTASCCCTLNYNSPKMSRYLVVERWLCMNGNVKERTRVTRGMGAQFNVTTSGESVRSFCSPDFAAGCFVATVNDKVSAKCFGGQTSKALELW